MTKATMIHPDGTTADVELHTIPADVDRLLGATAAVSYTHLTLPTKRIV